MRNEYLSFEQCLNRLKHSFLQEINEYRRSYIDFQHPSLRDMLLSLLQNEPNVRRKYISLASPQGLCDIIQGIPFFGSDPTNDVHSLIIRNEEELNLLCDQIRNVVTNTIPANYQIRLLNSAGILLRQGNTKTVDPSGVDFGRFLSSPNGKVLGTLLWGLADENIYRNNVTYTISSWVDILERFYKLVPYIDPVPRPKYLLNLASHIEKADILDGIRFVCLLSVNEPIIFKQVFSKELCQRWAKSLITKLDECYWLVESFDNISTGFGDGYKVTHLDYENWIEEAKDLLEHAAIFYSFSQIQQTDEFSALEGLLENIGPLHGPEEEGEIEEKDRSHGYDTYKTDREYWTIGLLFKDL